MSQADVFQVLKDNKPKKFKSKDLAEIMDITPSNAGRSAKKVFINFPKIKRQFTNDNKIEYYYED